MATESPPVIIRGTASAVSLATWLYVAPPSVVRKT